MDHPIPRPRLLTGATNKRKAVLLSLPKNAKFLNIANTLHAHGLLPSSVSNPHGAALWHPVLDISEVHGVSSLDNINLCKTVRQQCRNGTCTLDISHSPPSPCMLSTWIPPDWQANASSEKKCGTYCEQRSSRDNKQGVPQAYDI